MNKKILSLTALLLFGNQPVQSENYTGQIIAGTGTAMLLGGLIGGHYAKKNRKHRSPKSTALKICENLSLLGSITTLTGLGWWYGVSEQKRLEEVNKQRIEALKQFNHLQQKSNENRRLYQQFLQSQRAFKAELQSLNQGITINAPASETQDLKTLAEISKLFKDLIQAAQTQQIVEDLYNPLLPIALDNKATTSDLYHLVEQSYKLIEKYPKDKKIRIKMYEVFAATACNPAADRQLRDTICLRVEHRIDAVEKKIRESKNLSKSDQHELQQLTFILLCCLSNDNDISHHDKLSNMLQVRFLPKKQSPLTLYPKDMTYKGCFTQHSLEVLAQNIIAVWQKLCQQGAPSHVLEYNTARMLGEIAGHQNCGPEALSHITYWLSSGFTSVRKHKKIKYFNLRSLLNIMGNQKLSDKDAAHATAQIATLLLPEEEVKAKQNTPPPLSKESYTLTRNQTIELIREHRFDRDPITKQITTQLLSTNLSSNDIILKAQGLQKALSAAKKPSTRRDAYQAVLALCTQETAATDLTVTAALKKLIESLTKPIQTGSPESHTRPVKTEKQERMLAEMGRKK